MYQQAKSSRLLSSRSQQPQTSLSLPDTSPEDVCHETTITIEPLFELVPTLPDTEISAVRKVDCNNENSRRKVNPNTNDHTASHAAPAKLPPITRLPDEKQSKKQYKEFRRQLKKEKELLNQKSQARACHALRVEATRLALTFATEVLPFGAGNLEVDIFNSGGMSVPLTANAHDALKKKRKKSKSSEVDDLQDIADSAAKYGAGNCRDNAAVTFSFLCGLANKVSSDERNNSWIHHAKATSVNQEMFNAKISHVATTDNLHHYVIIGDWENDPENSYVVDSWLPLADVGLLYSEICDFKNIHTVTVKEPFNDRVSTGRLTSRTYHAPEKGDYPAQRHSKELLLYLSGTLQHVYSNKERKKIPSAPEHEKIMRDIHKNENLNRTSLKWRFFTKISRER
ncbi:hypothetical protein ACR9GP_23050 [Enterobacter ludwigii]